MPRSVGPFEILAPLGAGGMGEVFKARDTRLNRLVALKSRQRPSRSPASEIAGRAGRALSQRGPGRPGLPTRSRLAAGEDLSRRLLAPRLRTGDVGAADQREARGEAPSKGGASRSDAVVATGLAPGRTGGSH